MASWAPHDADDALLAVNYITGVATPPKTTHFHYQVARLFLSLSPTRSGYHPRDHPPPTPLYSLRSLKNLKPSLSAGFHDEAEKGGAKASSRQTSVSFSGRRPAVPRMRGGVCNGDGGSREASGAALG